MQKDNQIVEVGTKDISEEIARSFISDNKLFYLFKRVSKITKAICLVTSHIDNGQDIKGRIQKGALDLSDLVLSLSYTESSEEGRTKVVIFSRIMSLTSMLEILQSLGQVSKSNSTILLSQIKLFLVEVEQFFSLSDTNSIASSLQQFDFGNQDSESSVLDNEGFEFSNNETANLSASHNSTMQPVKLEQGIETTKLQTKVVQSSFHPTNTEFKERLSTAKSIEQLHGSESVDSKKTVPAISTQPSKVQVSPVAVDLSLKNENKNDRQTTIINTISTKGELSIKDLSVVIKGCSEKTIQRELIALVDRGILNKTGERRWSRYSLAH